MLTSCVFLAFLLLLCFLLSAVGLQAGVDPVPCVFHLQADCVCRRADCVWRHFRSCIREPHHRGPRCERRCLHHVWHLACHVLIAAGRGMSHTRRMHHHPSQLTVPCSPVAARELCHRNCDSGRVWPPCGTHAGQCATHVVRLCAAHHATPMLAA